MESNNSKVKKQGNKDCSISILVPTLGEREEELKRLLDSLQKQALTSLEVIILAQEKHRQVETICKEYSKNMDIVFVTLKEKGLSKARNEGLKKATGNVVLFSDDDCWYRDNALKNIICYFSNNSKIDILLTQIYDPDRKTLYKQYPVEESELTKARNMLSKSSIEIAYRRRGHIVEFDELFGLGAKYAAGEENDYLIRALKEGKKIHYEPMITVYHRKKTGTESSNQIIAKGALYSKHFGLTLSIIVLIRDLLIKRQNNFRWFWYGYFDYKKHT